MKNSPLGSPQLGPAVDILIESEAWRMLPEAEDIVRLAIAFAATSKAVICRKKSVLAVLLCDDETIESLNARWRGQEKPTNVLSFPAPPLRGDMPYEKIPLGDIAIAYETLSREASEQSKPVSDHLSHLVVHGFLHLVGYDHHEDGEAEEMERLECDILGRIGIADPYAVGDVNI